MALFGVAVEQKGKLQLQRALVRVSREPDLFSWWRESTSEGTSSPLPVLKRIGGAGFADSSAAVTLPVTHLSGTASHGWVNVSLGKVMDLPRHPEITGGTAVFSARAHVLSLEGHSSCSAEAHPCASRHGLGWKGPSGLQHQCLVLEPATGAGGSSYAHQAASAKWDRPTVSTSGSPGGLGRLRGRAQG